MFIKEEFKNDVKKLSEKEFKDFLNTIIIERYKEFEYFYYESDNISKLSKIKIEY